MSLRSLLEDTVKPIVPEIAEDEYLGEASTYCTYNMTELPIAHGNDRPHAIKYLIQLHLFLPFTAEHEQLKKQLRQGLIAFGFTAPTAETVEADALNGRHIVFEFEGVDGEV